MREAIIYPRNDFSAEYRDETETGGFGDGPRRMMVFKYVFPALTNRDAEKGVSYKLHTALVLHQTAVRNDMRSIIYEPVLKGIGESSRHRVTGTAAAVETAELVFEQIGLGSVQGALRAWLNHFYFGVEDTVTRTFDLKKYDVDFGDMRAKTSLLSGSKRLANNGFPTKGIHMIHDDSATVMSSIRLHMTPLEVQQTLEKARDVPGRYDSSARWLLRAYHPHSLFQNLGNPAASLYSVFSSSNTPEVVRHRNSIPLDPVERKKANVD